MNYEKIGKVMMTIVYFFLGFFWFFFAWVGSAQLAVALFGQENNIIIFIGSAGFMAGLYGMMGIFKLAYRIWNPKPKSKSRPSNSLSEYV